MTKGGEPDHSRFVNRCILQCLAASGDDVLHVARSDMRFLAWLDILSTAP